MGAKDAPIAGKTLFLGVSVEVFLEDTVFESEERVKEDADMTSPILVDNV